MARESTPSSYEERLRSLLQNVAAVVWTVDADLRVVFIAGDTELITGYTVDEIRAENTDAIWARAVHPDDLRRVMATHAGIFHTNEPFDVEYRYRRKDGTWAWLTDRASHVYERDGQQYMDGVTYDVTQHKNEEQQQIAAANFGRRAVQSADIHSLLADACETVATALTVDSATALWREHDSHRFTFSAVYGGPVPLPTKVVDDASVLAGFAYRADQAVAYEDLETESRFHAPALLATGLRSGISAPLRGRAIRYGLLSAHAIQRRKFTNRECAFVETIANVAADAIDRIETEHALASVAERYAQLVESADQGICALEDGRIVFANPALARMLSLTHDELLGREFATLATPQHIERLTAFIDASDQPAKIEVELAPASGAMLWAIVTRSRPTSGQTIVLITDITDRVRAEQDMRRRQAQLGDAQSLTHTGSFEIDLQTGTMEWSDEMFRICGLEPQSRPIDLAYTKSMTLPERESSFQENLRVLTEGGSIDSVHAFVRPDGLRRTVHTRARGTVDVDTGRRRAIGIMQDITAEVESQQALAEREARLQIIVSRLPVILWSTDNKLTITSAIGAGFNAIDKNFEELQMRVEDLIGPPPSGVSIDDALQNRPVSYDTWHGARELRVHIEPMRDASGAIVGTVGFAFDRTEQLRTERVLSNIAYGAISKIADEFFRSAVTGLANVLHVRFACIAKLDDDGDLQTVAVARDGETSNNFAYPITGTPCELVLQGTPCWIDDRVRTAFPDDQLLDDLDAVAYAGVPIIGTQGKPIGLVSVISSAPFPRNAAAEAALQIYADRAAVELDRMQYERSLVEEKEYVENLIDTANVVIIEIDADGRVRLVNRAFEILTGRPRAEVEGHELLDIVLDASPTHYLITTGPHEMEAQLLARDGERRLLRFRANDVRRAGRAMGTILFGIDITDERRAEHRQQQMQLQITHAAEEWRHTFDSVVSPILLLDADHRVARVNRAARDLTGHTYYDVVGTDFAVIAENEPLATVTRLLHEHENTAEAIDADGRTWTINVTPIVSPEEADAWSIIVLYDITRIVALQESVRVSEQMSAMGQLVAGVAHEVRNPLFGISAALDAFEEEFGRSGDFGEYIDRLRTDADRLHRLMNELLEYGRPAELQLAAQPFAAVIERSVRACEPVARQKQVALQVDVADTLSDAIIDRDRVVQVLKNVIENAIAFTPAGSKVNVAAREDVEERELVITIRDDGPGFRDDDLPRVFTPFFTRRRGGTGLGLAIVRRIVDGHGGSVAVRNGEHGGAVVEIRLPTEVHARDHAAQ